MGSPSPAPGALAPAVRPSSAPAVRFSYAGALKLASSVLGTSVVALAPHFGGQTWYAVLVAVAAGLGIHTVHTIGSGSGQAGGSNG